jgi:AraC family ethanolamine operon transcriptional activator
VFQKARDYIHHRLADGISILALCKEVGVSLRSLEGAFHSVIGNSPASFVRSLQLNRVRRDLTSADNDTQSIGMIAARHGIWHWSRFSRYYREMFGELPSQTRARRAREAIYPALRT